MKSFQKPLTQNDRDSNYLKVKWNLVLSTQMILDISVGSFQSYMCGCYKLSAASLPLKDTCFQQNLLHQEKGVCHGSFSAVLPLILSVCTKLRW